MLELKGISKYYNVGSVNEMCLFQDFNLNIEKGEFLSVVGSNGSGNGHVSKYDNSGKYGTGRQ